MSDSARLYAYKALFEAKRLVTKADMMKAAEVSLATFKRDIAKLRDQMGMPILFDKDRGGYYLDRNNQSTELPGLWFSPEELVALHPLESTYFNRFLTKWDNLRNDGTFDGTLLTERLGI